MLPVIQQMHSTLGKYLGTYLIWVLSTPPRPAPLRLSIEDTRYPKYFRWPLAFKTSAASISLQAESAQRSKQLRWQLMASGLCYLNIEPHSPRANRGKYDLTFSSNHSYILSKFSQSEKKNHVHVRAPLSNSSAIQEHTSAKPWLEISFHHYTQRKLTTPLQQAFFE